MLNRIAKAVSPITKLTALFVAGTLCTSPVLSQAYQLPPALTKDDFPKVDLGKVQLGKFLFFDPILSGNKNISCATCHHHDFFSGDGLSLGVGEGGAGLGTKRTIGQGTAQIKERVPRNAPALFNLGAKQIHTMFHDGRIMTKNTYGNRFDTPAEEHLPQGLDSLLAAQAMFPVTSDIEMAGNLGENKVALATKSHMRHVWPILEKRVRSIDAYGPLFYVAFDDINGPKDIKFTHIANALAAFMDFEWRSFNSPFDRYVLGDTNAMNWSQKQGMDLFFGKAGCSECHSGKLFTDQKFHALAIPQFGPGKKYKAEQVVRDLGRFMETEEVADAYRFKTPSLRNVAVTAPYGHNGAYQSLRGIVQHHLNPTSALVRWDRRQVVMPFVPQLANKDFAGSMDLNEQLRLRSKVDIRPVRLNEPEIQAVLSFLTALTGGDGVRGRLGPPTAVPSGLQLDRR